jgi:hypothetical protein
VGKTFDDFCTQQPTKNPEEKQNKEKPAGKKPSTALFYYHNMQAHKEKPAGKKPSTALFYYHNMQAHMSLKAGPTRHFVNISAILLSVGFHAMRILPAATASHT